jgi:hypothetical protein
MTNEQRNKLLRSIYKTNKTERTIFNAAWIISIGFLLALVAIIVFKIIKLYILPLFS